jgi:hypothetical protein
MRERMRLTHSQYELGQQPCRYLIRGDADIPALGHGNQANVHICPVCSGFRTWCENCRRDHHANGWETCKEENRSGAD